MVQKQALDGGEWCEVCHGGRFVCRDVMPGHEDFGVPKPCPCCNANFDRRKADEISMLLPGEITHGVDDLDPAIHTQAIIDAARFLGRYGTKMGILIGPNGCGKTYIGMAIIKEALDAGLSAVYAKAEDLLQQLRDGFDEHAQLSYSEVFERAKLARVLVIDELEKIGSSGWAELQIHNLIDERWRRFIQVATVGITNDFNALAPSVRSRFGDRERSFILIMQPVDIRMTDLGKAREQIADWRRKNLQRAAKLES